jgi:hypothetical protein
MDSEDHMTDSRLLVRPRAVRHLALLGLVGGGTFLTTACAREATQAATPAVTHTQAVGAAAGATPGAGALPVAVNCGAGQQALIRPALVNGQAISQVDCVAIAAPAVTPAVAYPAPAYPGAAYPAAAWPAAHPAPYRTASPDRVVYVPERRVARPGRSWKKSALVIGSSAGIGAGVGAAVGGRKGALIGAAVGGGGATLWDQITRRK